MKRANELETLAFMELEEGNESRAELLQAIAEDLRALTLHKPQPGNLWFH